MNIIIIGGGIAGTTAAEEIRSRDAEAVITIIEGELYPCYSRVLLPHYVKGKVAREKVLLKQLAWYEDKKIELMLGVTVDEIDTKNKFVRTSEDRELPYDALLLTTGTEIDLLGDDRRGVSYLSTLDDADHLRKLIDEVKLLPKEEQKALIYGGGFIALEYASIFAHFKLPFSIIMRSPGFWSRILSIGSQKILADHAAKNGVKLYFNEPAIELVGENELAAVRLKDGTVLPGKLLGVGIGAHANEPAVVAAKIPCNVGILANEYLETSVKDVYTAGDSAEFADTIVNRQIRYGNWMNALSQGRTVGKTMAGGRTAFALVSSYATNFLGLNIVFIGDTDRSLADEVRQAGASDTVSEELFFRQSKLVGAILIGDMKNRAVLTKAIGQTYGT